MKNEQLYHKTVDILVEAYFNDTLENLNVCGCAVGNLVAHHMNYEIIKDAYGSISWKDQSYPNEMGWATVHCIRIVNMENYTGLAKEQIDSTGYKPSETMKIEQAFESGYLGKDPMFNALCAVIDTLDEIHENTDTAISNTSKQKFVKV